jgi:hypothetical protein
MGFVMQALDIFILFTWGAAIGAAFLFAIGG